MDQIFFSPFSLPPLSFLVTSKNPFYYLHLVNETLCYANSFSTRSIFVLNRTRRENRENLDPFVTLRHDLMVFILHEKIFPFLVPSQQLNTYFFSSLLFADSMFTIRSACCVCKYKWLQRDQSEMKCAEICSRVQNGIM
jgi:hypothetical protein